MIEHPWAELQVLIKEKWLTQKAFASILWKKVSEVNELLKWKRNITIQRDYLLHQTLWTPIKYWILKQVDYDYSLLDIEEQKSPPSVRGEAPKELGGFSDHTSHSEQSEESKKTWNQMDSSVDSLPQNDNNDVILNDSEVYSSSWESTEHHIRHSEPEARSASEGRENPSNTTPMDFSLQSKWQTIAKLSQFPILTAFRFPKICPLISDKISSQTPKSDIE